MKKYRSLMVGGAISALVACGGGGGSGLTGDDIASGGNTPPTGSPSSYQAGVFPNADEFDALCESPRSGQDRDGRSFPDRQGSANDEKMWLRSWTNDLYLWYDEVPDRNPASYSIPDYFELLKTADTAASGRPKDNFHFSQDTAEWEQLSQSGVSSGYGARFAIDNEAPRSVTVMYTEPNSPATSAPALLARGTRIISIDGTSITTNTQAGLDVLNAGLFPREAGEQHEFEVQDLGSPSTRTITMTSADVVSSPVQNVRTVNRGESTIGYMLFNSHIATAERGLVEAVETLEAAEVDELVLDIRYNGGGTLVIAAQLAYMVAGANATNGKTFELIQFNDKHPVTDPVTGRAIRPIPFISETIGLSIEEGDRLPALNLSRVFVLTSDSTCSASESIINGLRGADIEVVQIGKTTCGKPYGFYPTDNCGTTYFSVQFQGVNDKGFGEFPDGFSPQESPTAFGVTLPGCDVNDDLGHALGDENEARFAASLHYIETGECPSTFANSGILKSSVPSFGGFEASQEPRLIGVNPALQGKILGVQR